MPKRLRLYLDQCLRLEVAEALRDEGYDVLRASEVGQARADDFEVLNLPTQTEESWSLWTSTLATGWFYR